MKAVLALSLLCLGTYAQLPKPCNPPPQWEGRLLRVDRVRNYRVYAKLSYDGINQRYRRIEELQEGSEEEQLDVIHLFKESKEYRIDLKTQKCNTTTNVRPWRPYGVPMNANFTGSAVLGGAGLSRESLVINTFYGRLSPNMSFAGVVTYTGCIPIQLDYIDTYSGQINVEHNTFFDITAGIKDPSVFTPPSQCKK